MGFKFKLFGNLKKKEAQTEHPASGNTAASGMMPDTAASFPTPVTSPDMGQINPQMSQPQALPPAGITDDINALVAKGT